MTTMPLPSKHPAFDSIAQFERAVLARLSDARVLRAGERHSWAVYTLGYVIEMKLKSAYFRLRGLKETDETTGTRTEAVGHAKQLGMAKLGGHNLVFWLQMIINERQAASRSLPCEFASEAMVRVSQVAKHWDTEMRYRDAVKAAGEVREVAFAASWLLQNERVLWG